MKFITATGDGFCAAYITVCLDGSAMVSVGASVEREDEGAREENIEIVVRIPNATGMPINALQRLAMQRAAVIARAVAESLTPEAKN